MPGTGRKNILELLSTYRLLLRVLGNWEDSLWRACHRKLDETRPSFRYLLRQCQYIMEKLV